MFPAIGGIIPPTLKRKLYIKVLKLKKARKELNKE
jgi:hypothetical protein